MSYKLNRIIESILRSNWDIYSENLELVSLNIEQVLFSIDVPMDYIYFPINCIISLKCQINDEELANFSLVGNEGMVGAFVFMGAGAGISSAKVEHAGIAYQLPVQKAIDIYSQSTHFRDMVLRYLQVLVADALQTTYCEIEHETIQKICRALLTFDDRLLGDKAAIPEDLLARAVGISTAELQEAVLSPQIKKMLSYDNGFLVIENRADIESYCCECYCAMRNKLDSLLPIPSPKS
jgi:hypothetical protein